MESKLGDRLNSFIRHSGLSKNEFGAKFNSNQQEVSNWLRGTKMNLGRISDMLRVYPEINPGWFIAGRGEMLQKDYEKAELERGYHICYDESCNLEKEKLHKENRILQGKILQLTEKIVVLLESNTTTD